MSKKKFGMSKQIQDVTVEYVKKIIVNLSIFTQFVAEVEKKRYDVTTFWLTKYLKYIYIQ